MIIRSYRLFISCLLATALSSVAHAVVPPYISYLKNNGYFFMDFFYIGFIVGMFAMAIGLIVLCEKL